MPRHHMKASGKVFFTPSEEAEADTREAALLAGMELVNWEEAMLATDVDVSRRIEDIYDVLTTQQQSAIATETRDKIIAKKALRATRPT